MDQAASLDSLKFEFWINLTLPSMQISSYVHNVATKLFSCMLWLSAAGWTFQITWLLIQHCNMMNITLKAWKQEIKIIQIVSNQMITTMKAYLNTTCAVIACSKSWFCPKESRFRQMQWLHHSDAKKTSFSTDGLTKVAIFFFSFFCEHYKVKNLHYTFTIFTSYWLFS